MRWGLLDRFRDSRGDEPEEVTAVIVAARSAALLRGGLHPVQVMRSLARETASPTLLKVIERIELGEKPGDALAAVAGPDWRVLGAAWMLAEQSGASFAPVLDRIALALRSIDELSARREVLLAAPRMTIRLVALLPLASVGVGVVLGFDPLPVFLTPFGAALLVVGILLQLLGVHWTRRLTSRVEAEDRVAGLECELMWVALAGGAPPGSARVRVADAVSDARAEWIEFASLCRGTPLDLALREAVNVGVPASSLLLDAAHAQRTRIQAELERAAERLGVRILVPIATCILPAFIVLGVFPVIVRLLGSVFPVTASI